MRRLLGVLAIAVLLAACGGTDELADEWERVMGEEMTDAEREQFADMSEADRAMVEESIKLSDDIDAGVYDDEWDDELVHDNVDDVEIVTGSVGETVSYTEDVEHFDTGETVAHGWAVTVTDITCSTDPIKPHRDDPEVEPQGQFCTVEASVEHQGDAPWAFQHHYLTLHDTEGREFTYDDVTLDLDSVGELQPGQSGDGVFIFDLPTDAEPELVGVIGEYHELLAEISL